jgi:hypothetical protein
MQNLIHQDLTIQTISELTQLIKFSLKDINV